MNGRNIWIAIGVLGLAGLLCVGAVAGGALAYTFIQRNPVSALAAPFRQAEVTPQSGAPESGAPQNGAPQVVPDQPGVLVAGVATGSPAEQAGLLRGDVILKINGTEVNDFAALKQQVSAAKSGDQVELIISRGGNEQTLTATLGDQNGQAYLGVQPCSCEAGGRRGRREAFPFQAEITAVTAGSPAEKAGLKAGDVITAVDGVSVQPGSGILRLLATKKPGDPLTLTVSHEGQADRQVTVTLGEDPNQAGKPYLGITLNRMPDTFPMMPGSPRMPTGPMMPGGQDGYRWPRGFGQGQTPDLPDGITAAAIIANVTAGSPAEAAGLKSGDLITAVDGQALAEANRLAQALGNHKPGDQVTLSVWSSANNSLADVQVTLGENPEQAGKAYLGIEFSEFVKQEKQVLPQSPTQPAPQATPAPAG